jgi:SRSO17 transposase
VSRSSSSGDSESRVAGYVEALGAALGHADRIAPLRNHCAGLVLPGDRKSIEPMAARVHPQRVQATHQSLHHLIAKAGLPDALRPAAKPQIVLEQNGRRG